MLRPSLREVAFDYDRTTGDAGLNVLSGLNYNLPPLTTPVLFPGPGTTTDLPVFGGESPSPLETCLHDDAFPDWQGNYALVGLPLIVLLTTPPSPSLAAQLTTPSGETESTSNGGLCVVDINTYYTSDTIYGSTGADILQRDNAVILIPRVPLISGTYNASVSQPGQTNITWSFESSATEHVLTASRNRQSVVVRHPFAAPLTAYLSVRSSDSRFGGSLDDVPVTFAVTSGSASFDGSPTAVVLTDPNGIAAAPQLTAGHVGGPVAVSAATPGIARAAAFKLLVLPTRTSARSPLVIKIRPTRARKPEARASPLSDGLS